MLIFSIYLLNRMALSRRLMDSRRKRELKRKAERKLCVEMGGYLDPKWKKRKKDIQERVRRTEAKAKARKEMRLVIS